MYEGCFAEVIGNTPEEYCLSLDYGTQNAFAAVLWGKFGDTWYGLKEYYYSGRTTGIQKTDQEYFEDLCDFIGPISNLETIVDPSAASFITLFNRKGKGKFKVRKADNAVEDGLRETATALKSGRVKISPNMKNWKKEAGGYIWDPKSHEDKPLKENDHLMDVTRYFVKTKKISEEKKIYKSVFEGRRYG